MYFKQSLASFSYDRDTDLLVIKYCGGIVTSLETKGLGRTNIMKTVSGNRSWFIKQVKRFVEDQNYTIKNPFIKIGGCV